MKLAAISMIRDEADVVAGFLRHLDAMFDIVILLDQRSSDGSTAVMKAACGQRADWRYYLCDFAGRHQKEMINFFMPKAFEMGADALFSLDSDEFIALETRDELNSVRSTCGTMWPQAVFSGEPASPFASMRHGGLHLDVARMSRGPTRRPRPSEGGISAGDSDAPASAPSGIARGPIQRCSPPRARIDDPILSLFVAPAGFAQAASARRLESGLHGSPVGGQRQSSDRSWPGDTGWRVSFLQREAIRRTALHAMIAEAFEKQVLAIARSALPLPELGQPDFDAALAQALLEFKFELSSGPAPAFDVRGDVISLRDGQSITPEQISSFSATFGDDAEIGNAREELVARTVSNREDADRHGECSDRSWTDPNRNGECP